MRELLKIWRCIILTIFGVMIAQSQITLMSPNGGECWTAGTTHSVTWTSSGVSTVKLEYTTNNGNTWLPMSINKLASGGSYDWTIPNVPSKQCRVKVLDAAIPATYDSSNGFFSIDYTAHLDTFQRYFKAGSTVNYVNDIAMTFDGGYAIVGTTDVIGGGSSDIYYAKLDCNGIKLWEKNYGTTDQETGHSIIQTADSGFVLTGSNSTTSKGYVIKIDHNGSISWSITLDSPIVDAGEIHQTGDGGFLVLGSNNGNTFYLTKLTSSGGQSWRYPVKVGTASFGSTFQPTFDGGYVLGGIEWEGPYYGLTTKINSSGVVQWSRTVAGTYSGIYKVIQDQNNNIVSSGNDGSYGHSIPYLVKYNSSGSLQWQKSLGSYESGLFFDILNLHDGNYLVTGYSGSTGYSKVLLFKYSSSSGDLLSERTIGDSISAQASCLTDDGRCVVVGSKSSGNRFYVQKTSYPDTTLHYFNLTTSITGQGSIKRSLDRARYRRDSTVTLTAIPDSNFVFTGWSGSYNDTTNPVVVTVDAEKNIIANFAELHYYTINTTINGQGRIERSPDQTDYLEGTSVVLTAIPDSNYDFKGWSGSATGTTNPLTIAADADKNIVANFYPNLSMGLVAYYPFNGNVDDESGRGNNATIHGATLTSDQFGRDSSAYYFNGVDNWIRASGDSMPRASRTVSLWLRVEEGAIHPVPLAYGGGVCGTTFQLGLTLGNPTWYGIGQHCSSPFLIGSSVINPVGNWHHFVAITDTAGSKIYMDRILIASDPALFMNGTLTEGTDLAFGVDVDWRGIAPYCDSNVGWMKGSLDDIRIYNRALSESEITLLYHEGGFGLGNIRGTVFHDIFGNGILDGSDSTLSEWKIFLNNSAGLIVDSQTTNSMGQFEFIDLAPGTYLLIQYQDSNWIQTIPTGIGSYTITISDSETVIGKDFGNTHTYRYTKGYNGNWSDSVNWSGGVPPTSDKFVSIPTGVVVTVDSLPQDTVSAIRVEGTGTLQFSDVVSKLSVLRTLQIDNGATLEFPETSDTTGLVCYRDWVNRGTLEPGHSVIKFVGNQPKVIASDGGDNTFFKLDISGDSTSVIGNFTIKNQLVIPKGIVTRDQDSIVIQNSDTSAIADTGIILNGTIVREIKPGETGTYRFESPLTYVKFNGEGENPSAVSMKVLPGSGEEYFYWDTLTSHVDTNKKRILINPLMGPHSRWPIGPPRPKVIHTRADSLYFKIESVNRVYSVNAEDGSNYGAEVSLRYESGNTPGLSTHGRTVSSATTSESELQVFRGPYYSGTVQAKWNMISLPLNPDSAIKDSLFPPPISNAFAYEGSYISRPKLNFGEGYWMKFPEAQEVIIGGNDIDSFAITVNAGWNMIGSISYPVSVTSIRSTPVDIIASEFFGYGTSYEIVETLKPMHGYWVKSSSAGKLVLTASIGGPLSKESSVKSSLQGLNVLTIEDSKQNEGRLSFGSGANVDVSRYMLPPVPPEGMYDVRFATGNMLAVAGEQKDNEVPIQIHSAEYPVTIQWEMMDAAQSASLIVDGKVMRINQSGSIVITDSEADIRLKLTSEIINELPKEYSLEQNYPNPFNPTTTIKYNLPSESRVKLTIYNVLGQTVSVLRDGIEDVGYRSVNWNASSVASGIYFYKIEATSTSDNSKSFMQVKKMILLK
jgi:uncharacterized repeat protein (TIGR02543 family)